VDTIMLPPDAPLAGALKQSPAWHLIYDDGVALIFRSAHATALKLELPPANPSRRAQDTTTASTYPKDKRL
jgi:hypothetical protein